MHEGPVLGRKVGDLSDDVGEAVSDLGKGGSWSKVTLAWLYREAGREEDGRGLLLLDLDDSRCFLVLLDVVLRASLSLSLSFSLSFSRLLSGSRVRTGVAEA